MKQLLIIILLGMPILVFPQWEKNPCQITYTSTYVPAGILFGTFCAVNMGDTQRQRDRIAFTGMVTAATTYFVIEGIQAKRAKKKHRIPYSEWVVTNK